MDAFTTEAFGELTVQKSGLIGVFGITNGKLNQSVIVNDQTDNKLSVYGKLGYDKQINEDFRLRVTGSGYVNNGTSTGTSLFGGDRAGARYYNVMAQPAPAAKNDFDGRFNPAFKQMTALQLNPFVKFRGLEFFGVLETVSNSEEQGDGKFTQLAAELLYRFGSTEQFYIGGRYNDVSGKSKASDTEEINITRMNIGGGWFMTNNIIVKMEYMDQQYKSGYDAASKYNGGEFHGFNIEAAISF